MSRAVWKWEIPLETSFAIEMPKGAEILSVQTQYQRGPGEAGALWALVDPGAAQETRRFRLLGTGHHDDDPGRYVGTFQLTGGTLVLHVFERARHEGEQLARPPA